MTAFAWLRPSLPPAPAPQRFVPTPPPPQLGLGALGGLPSLGAAKHDKAAQHLAVAAEALLTANEATSHHAKRDVLRALHAFYEAHGGRTQALATLRLTPPGNPPVL